MLITNSDYHYTNKMMSFAYNSFMPQGSTWRDLFDMVSLLFCSLLSSSAAIVSKDHEKRTLNVVGPG